MAIDDRIKSEEFGQSSKTVQSIYAIDFSGSGIIKLAYNVKEAKEYDDNTVYYIAAEAPGLAVLGVFGGVVAGLIGLAIKYGGIGKTVE